LEFQTSVDILKADFVLFLKLQTNRLFVTS